MGKFGIVDGDLDAGRRLEGGNFHSADHRFHSLGLAYLRYFVHFRPEIGAGVDIIEVHLVVGVKVQRMRTSLRSRPK